MSGSQQAPSASIYHASYQAARQHGGDQDVLIERLLKRGIRTDARRELERAAPAIPNRQACREALAQLGR